MKYALRMTEAQHMAMQSHLFPGDGNEAVVLLLCGRRKGIERHIFLVQKVVTVPHNVCIRQPDRITWPTDYVDELLHEAYGKGCAIIKVHSHSSDYRWFSPVDDQSDNLLFTAIASLLDDELPHASIIMLPGGELLGRVLDANGNIVGNLDSIMIVGDELKICMEYQRSSGATFTMRHAQAFGSGTIEILRNLSVAVVGCSGTGSIVVEQLARLGVGRLLLVDPDVVEEKNLNRILNTGKEDAYLKRPKVHAIASAIARMGLGQEVIPLQQNLISPEMVMRVAECDIVFGCMDSVEGRHILNRIATFYNMPYFDVGVRLDADGAGGIEQITGAVHYLQPGLSSLLSRGVYNMSRVDAEAMRRISPEMYQYQVKEGYLRGVEEDKPAVISVNMFFAALVVNDLLARLHSYRTQPNGKYAYIGGSLSEMQLYPEAEADPCQVLAQYVGKGDVVPLLERASLS